MSATEDVLAKAHADLVKARLMLESATRNARIAALAAAADGVPDAVIARKLGVDRARTVRRWLGKL
jgi:hypothetical protein